jgi:hypothetical protein
VNKLIKISLAAALPALWAAGCSDFLKGGELTNNPNVPVQGSATNGQLFVAIQASWWNFNNSEAAWSIAQFMQELYGAARQQVGIYNYSGITNATFDGDFQIPYTGGGLVDIRQLEAQATAGNDLFYLGVAQVMEAWLISQTADMWGDIPYSQAVNYTAFPTPKLDTQQSVYDSVQNLLTTAIANINSGTGTGPTTSDLVYGGSAAKWTALAHTIKARIYLHMVAPGWATYAQVLTEANLGISSSAGDYVVPYNSASQFESNNWWQFMSANGGTGRAGDMIVLNSTQLPAMLLAAGDPRYGEYFDSTNSNNSFMSNYRLSAGYQQPVATYAENQLILAEANCGGVANCGGGAAAALVNLHNAQTSWHSATVWHNALGGVALSGSATMANIMNEKYITLFQSVEIWNDWKRTCIPALAAIGTGTPNPLFPGIPARMYYGLTEQQTNSGNVPAPGTAPNVAFNSNDPGHGCGTVHP